MLRNKVCHRRRQTGSYIVWVLILVPVLVGGLALVFNAGNALATHQQARTAADAAAFAAALAVQREMDNLLDAATKDAAKARVIAAANHAAGENGFNQVTVHWPADKSIFAPYNVAPTNMGYVGVEVSKQAQNILLVEKMYGLLAPVSAVSLARVGSGAGSETNTCPGIYVYGKQKKVTDLKGGSDFKVLNGGIYLGSDGANALYGSNPSTMTAQWIEVGDGSNFPNSVTYYCDNYPGGNPLCVKGVQKREEPDLNLPSTTCSTTNSKCVISGGKLKCNCSLDKKGVPSCTTSELPLEAGRYCGLKIFDSGTDAAPLVLRPSATTNIWDVSGANDEDWDGLVLSNSVVKGDKDPNYEGIVFYDKSGPLTTKDKSTLKGDVRIYFNSIDMNNDSLVEITSFEEAGCGKLIPAISTVVVQ